MPPSPGSARDGACGAEYVYGGLRLLVRCFRWLP